MSPANPAEAAAPHVSRWLLPLWHRHPFHLHIAVLFSVVGAFYYLRIVKLMYFDDPVDSTVIGGSTLVRTVLSANALLAFALGVIPGALLQLCQRALQ